MTAWLDLHDLTKYLKMPKSSLYKLVQQEKLPGYKVGRGWRFDREEVDKWIKKNRNGKKTAVRGSAK